MKILWPTAYYDPEQMSSSHLINDIEEAFVKAGYSFEIHTPTPTRGVSPEVRSHYKKIKRQEKYGGKIKIHRFSMPAETSNPLLRFIRYALCNAVQYLKGRSAKNLDVIYCVSTPPTQGLLCSFIKKKHKIPFIYNLQDIFPDSLFYSGLAAEDSFLYKIGRKIENYTYKNADKIIVISQDFKNNILAKGVPEEKIEVIYNWVDENAVVPVKREENPLFDEFQFDRNNFYVVYAGNLGAAQGIDVILNAAELLLAYKDIQIIIFGDGTNKARYQSEVEKRGLKNIVMLPLLPEDRVSQVYSLGDVSIVSCKEGGGKSALPSKTWSILSAGTAIIANFDEQTELQRIIEGNEVGLFTKAGDTKQFIEAILELYNDKEKCSRYGTNAREFIISKMNKKSATQSYIKVFEDVCAVRTQL